MGGTFDPIHYGHLVCAEEARHQFNLDEVIFIPAGHPWQKEDTSDAEDRYMLVTLATADDSHFSVSRIEIDRRGPTYTLDTLRILNDFYGEMTEVFFITGADAVLDILTWKDADAVLSRAHFIAATRPGFDLAKLESQQFAGRVSPMHIPALAISSTDIRLRVREGRPIRYLMPPHVADYIIKNGMYIRKSAVESGAVGGLGGVAAANRSDLRAPEAANPPKST